MENTTTTSSTSVQDVASSQADNGIDEAEELSSKRYAIWSRQT